MKTLTISSPEMLDARIAVVIHNKTLYTAKVAEMEARKQEIEKDCAEEINRLVDAIASEEEAIQDYCTANRGELFAEKKSRENISAVFGFEFTPWRVEPVTRKITWKEIVKRLGRLAWGKAYLNHPEPKPDKESLLKDRERLKEEQLGAAGIKFERDEQFFIRPKSPAAEDTVVKEAA